MAAIPLGGMNTQDPLGYQSTIVNDGRPNTLRECLDDDDDIDMEKWMDYQDKKRDLEISMFKFVTRGNEDEDGGEDEDADESPVDEPARKRARMSTAAFLSLNKEAECRRAATTNLAIAISQAKNLNTERSLILEEAKWFGVDEGLKKRLEATRDQVEENRKRQDHFTGILAEMRKRARPVALVSYYASLGLNGAATEEGSVDTSTTAPTPA
jgi:hypothetical protein